MLQACGTGNAQRHLPRLATAREDGPYNAVLQPLVKSLDVAGSLLSVHFDGESGGKVLARAGAVDGDDLLAAAVMDHADAMVEWGPGDGEQVDRAWLGPVGQAGRPLLSVVFRSAATRSRVVFSAVFGRDGPPDRKLVAATLRRLLPMLDAYFLLWQRNREETRCNRGLRSALDSVDLGVVLVDRSGAPGFANAAATALLVEGRFLRQRGAAIHANNFRDTMRLQAALAAAIAANAGEGAGPAGGSPDSAQLKLTSGDSHLIVAALPAEQPADEPGAAAAMLIMLRPDGEPEKVAAPVCKIFGLSGVETRLACQLVTGRSLSEACDAMRIRETTGRGYLKQIFAKTNVNRQAELVRVLLSSIVRARSKGLIQVI